MTRWRLLLALLPVTILITGCGGSATSQSFESQLGKRTKPELSRSESHGGTRLLFVVAALLKPSGGVEHRLWSMRADGSDAKRLTTVEGTAPTGSADGKHIVFAQKLAGPEGDVVSTLWTMRADSDKPRLLLPEFEKADSPEFRPDGKKLVFHTIGDTASEQKLWLVNADGSKPTQITPEGLRWAADGTFSPDGTKLAYGYGDGEAITGVAIADADGTHERRLFETPFTDINSQPAFSPDGTRIVFRRLGFDSNGVPHTGLYIVGVRGGRPKRVIDRLGNQLGDPIWTLDGERILFSLNGKKRPVSIYSVAPDGSDLQRIKQPDTPNAGAAWLGR